MQKKKLNRHQEATQQFLTFRYLIDKQSGNRLDVSMVCRNIFYLLTEMYWWEYRGRAFIITLNDAESKSGYSRRQVLAAIEWLNATGWLIAHTSNDELKICVCSDLASIRLRYEYN